MYSQVRVLVLLAGSQDCLLVTHQSCVGILKTMFGQVHEALASQDGVGGFKRWATGRITRWSVHVLAWQGSGEFKRWG